jgi:raffinose/stachyose/melibiose transport system permease protein
VIAKPSTERVLVEAPLARSAPARRRRRAGIATSLVLAVASLAVLFPFYLIFVTALKDRNRVAENPLGLPDSWHWSNFTDAWNFGNFDQYFTNSVVVTSVTVVGVLGCSLLAAYAFALMRFPGSGVIFVLFIAGLTIPLDILIIPLFYEMFELGLLNTVWALILPQIALGLPLGVLLLRAFIQDIPRDLIDAARMDGCGHGRLLLYLVFPLSRPALFALLVFTFMWTWNQFLLPLILTQDDSARTIPIGLSFFKGKYDTDIPLLMAGVTIALAPIVLVYFLFQRQIIRGITTGGLK